MHLCASCGLHLKNGDIVKVEQRLQQVPEFDSGVICDHIVPKAERGYEYQFESE